MRVSFRQNLLPEEGGFAVKRKRFSVEQIVAVLKQAEMGVPVAELIRQVGISEQTLYRWKKQHKGLETDQVRQFKQLQEENGRLKRVVAEADLGQGDAAGRAGKKTVTPSRRRPVVSYWHDTHRNHSGNSSEHSHADGGRSVRRSAGKPANRQADCSEHSVGREDPGED